MSLEHIFRNLNDIRLFDVMSDLIGEKSAVDIDFILELLDYPQREFIQIEDSIKHLVETKILGIHLSPEETTTGCYICRQTDESLITRCEGHENHVLQKTEIVNVENYYMLSNNLTVSLIESVMINSFDYAEEVMSKK